MIGHEGTVCCAAMIVSEETTWKITKTNYDQFPDWLTKRKYLNNNNIDDKNNSNSYLGLMISFKALPCESALLNAKKSSLVTPR